MAVPRNAWVGSLGREPLSACAGKWERLAVPEQGMLSTEWGISGERQRVKGH